MGVIWGTFVIVALLLLLTIASEPWFARPNILFGVAFDVKDLKHDATALGLKRQYAIWCVGLMVVIWGSAAAIAVQFNTELIVTVALMIAMVLYLVATFVLQIFFHQQSLNYHDKLALPSTTTKVSVDLTALANQKILSLAWGLVLFPLILVTFVLHMPAMMIGVNIMIALIMGITFVFGRYSAASIKGSSQVASGVAQGRNAVLVYGLGITVLTQAFIIASTKFPQWVLGLSIIFGIVSLGSLLILIIYWLKQSRAKPLKGPIVDDNGHWLFGSIYYNPADPTVFVEKRLGIGVTLNMARPGAWLFLGITLASVGVILGITFAMG